MRKLIFQKTVDPEIKGCIIRGLAEAQRANQGLRNGLQVVTEVVFSEVSQKVKRKKSLTRR